MLNELNELNESESAATTLGGVESSTAGADGAPLNENGSFGLNLYMRRAHGPLRSTLQPCASSCPEPMARVRESVPPPIARASLLRSRTLSIIVVVRRSRAHQMQHDNVDGQIALMEEDLESHHPRCRPRGPPLESHSVRAGF